MFLQDAYMAPDAGETYATIDAATLCARSAITLVGGAVDFWNITSPTDFNIANGEDGYAEKIAITPATIKTHVDQAISQQEQNHAIAGENIRTDWVPMFTYDFHADCDLSRLPEQKKEWVCCGRINSNGGLEFRFVPRDSVSELNAGKDTCLTSYAIGLHNDVEYGSKELNGNAFLQLASIEESENYMLTADNKLRTTTNPMLLGVLSNAQAMSCVENANSAVTNASDVADCFTVHVLTPAASTTISHEEYNNSHCAAVQTITSSAKLGFIYTVWGTIKRNVLYMVSLKLPIPGGNSYLVRGSVRSGVGNAYTPYWYRLKPLHSMQTTDYNERLRLHTLPLTLADCAILNGETASDTITAVRKFFREDYATTNVDSQLTIYDVSYEGFNVEAYLEEYGVAEDIEEDISLATAFTPYDYWSGMKPLKGCEIRDNWYGDLDYRRVLVSDSGVFETTKGDLIFSANDTAAYFRNIFDEASEGYSGFLCTDTAKFILGNAAGDTSGLLQAMLNFPTQEPREPSVYCFMGTRTLCTNPNSCATAYNNGPISDAPDCGGPFIHFRVGTPKYSCIQKVYDPNNPGICIGCNGYNTTTLAIKNLWDHFGLKDNSIPATCGNNTGGSVPPLEYTQGSRPLAVGGTMVGGVGFIYATVKQKGDVTYCRFDNKYDFKAWNSFFTDIGTDLSSCLFARFDTAPRGDLTCSGGDYTALNYNEYVYNTGYTDSGIVELCTGYYHELHEPLTINGRITYPVEVFIHREDANGYVTQYKVVVSGSYMSALYNSSSARKLQFKTQATVYGIMDGFEWGYLNFSNFIIPTPTLGFQGFDLKTSAIVDLASTSSPESLYYDVDTIFNITGITLDASAIPALHILRGDASLHTITCSKNKDLFEASRNGVTGAQYCLVLENSLLSAMPTLYFSDQEFIIDPCDGGVHMTESGPEFKIRTSSALGTNNIEYYKQSKHRYVTAPEWVYIGIHTSGMLHLLLERKLHIQANLQVTRASGVQELHLATAAVHFNNYNAGYALTDFATNSRLTYVTVTSADALLSERLARSYTYLYSDILIYDNRTESAVRELVHYAPTFTPI